MQLLVAWLTVLSSQGSLQLAAARGHMPSIWLEYEFDNWLILTYSPFVTSMSYQKVDMTFNISMVCR